MAEFQPDELNISAAVKPVANAILKGDELLLNILATTSNTARKRKQGTSVDVEQPANTAGKA